MAITRRNLRLRIVDSYGLPPEYPDWINERWLNVQIDRGMRFLAETTENIQGTCAMTVAARTRTYNLETDFLRLRSVEANSNRTLEKITRDKIEAVYGDSWRADTGALAYWYEEDYRKIGLYPMPATAGSVITCYGPRYMTVFSSDTVASEIPTALEDVVVNYVGRELAQIDPSPIGARRFQLYNARVNDDLTRYRTIVRPAAMGTEFTAPRR